MYQRKATFDEAIKSALVENYCNFAGRSSRSQYWWYVLFTFIIGVALALLQQIGDFGKIFSVVVNLALLLPGLGVVVRRLHDIGKSGWWYLIVLIPLVGAIILIVWLCKDSEMYPNQWGDVPLAEE